MKKQQNRLSSQTVHGASSAINGILHSIVRILIKLALRLEKYMTPDAYNGGYIVFFGSPTTGKTTALKDSIFLGLDTDWFIFNALPTPTEFVGKLVPGTYSQMDRYRSSSVGKFLFYCDERYANIIYEWLKAGLEEYDYMVSCGVPKEVAAFEAMVQVAFETGCIYIFTNLIENVDHIFFHEDMAAFDSVIACRSNYNDYCEFSKNRGTHESIVDRDTYERWMRTYELLSHRKPVIDLEGGVMLTSIVSLVDTYLSDKFQELSDAFDTLEEAFDVPEREMSYEFHREFHSVLKFDLNSRFDQVIVEWKKRNMNKVREEMELNDNFTL